MHGTRGGIFNRDNAKRSLALIDRLKHILKQSVMLYLRIFKKRKCGFIRIAAVFAGTRHNRSGSQSRLAFRSLYQPAQLPAAADDFVLQCTGSIHRCGKNRCHRVALLAAFFLHIVKYFALTLLIQNRQPSFNFIFGHLF